MTEENGSVEVPVEGKKKMGRPKKEKAPKAEKVKKEKKPKKEAKHLVINVLDQQAMFNEHVKRQLRVLVRGYSDIQKLRIMMGQRVVADVKVRIGQVPGLAESMIGWKAQDLLTSVRSTYRRMTDGMVRLPKIQEFIADPEGVIDSYTFLCMCNAYERLLQDEASLIATIKGMVHRHPLWTQYLVGVAGIGECSAAVLISEFDIHKAQYPSSLCKYSGLGVVQVKQEDGSFIGVAQTKKPEALVMVQYKAKDGTMKWKKSISFNPFLKSKLIAVMMQSFLKITELRDKETGEVTRPMSEYAVIYRHERFRLDTDPRFQKKVWVTDKATGKKKQVAEYSKGRRHLMAARKALKFFLCDLYIAWRTIEKLPVAPSYAEAKLGIVHGSLEGRYTPEQIAAIRARVPLLPNGSVIITDEDPPALVGYEDEEDVCEDDLELQHLDPEEEFDSDEDDM